MIWLSAALMLSACTEPREDQLTFDKMTADKEVTLSNDEGSPKCAVHLTLAYATDANGHKARLVNEAIARRLLDMDGIPLRHAIDSFANAYTRAYVKNYLPLYNQDRADTTKRSWYEYHYVITSEAHEGYSGISVYTATIDYFEGGAHGMNLRNTLNFDNKTGKQLSLGDLFVDGYERQLNRQLLKALCEKTETKNLTALREKGYLQGMEMYATENFQLESETITFIYNPYEIAPYALGATELTISLETLKPILRPKPLI